MMSEEFTVGNVKCAGCVTRIQQGLQVMAGVDQVEVDVTKGRVTITGNEFSKDKIAEALNGLGYPVTA